MYTIHLFVYYILLIPYSTLGTVTIIQDFYHVDTDQCIPRYVVTVVTWDCGFLGFSYNKPMLIVSSATIIYTPVRQQSL